MANTDYILETIIELERFAQQTNQTKLLARVRLTREIFNQELMDQSGKLAEVTPTVS
jgi:hypothetical protein